MTDNDAIKMLRELGEIYATALAEKGHNIDEKSPLMNGLAAYYMLGLRGEFEELDEGVDLILKVVYDLVKEKLGNAKSEVTQ